MSVSYQLKRNTRSTRMKSVQSFGSLNRLMEEISDVDLDLLRMASDSRGRQ
jgi:hypothetical protein